MHGKMLRTIDSNDLSAIRQARKDYENEVESSGETFDSWSAVLSLERAGEGGDLSNFEHKRGEVGVNYVYAREQDRDSTRHQERSGRDYRIDWEEADRIIAGLYKMLAELDAEGSTRVKMSRKATGEAATLTEDQHADFGWVRENDVLTNGEWEDFTSKFAGVLSGSIYAPQTKSGEYMIAVSDIDDKVHYGINNIIVYAKGSIESPRVTRVLEIDLDNETSLDEQRRDIYALEGRGIQPKTGGIFHLHAATDSRYLWDGQGNDSQGSRYHNQLRADRGAGRDGAAEAAGRNVTLRRSGEKATLTLHNKGDNTGNRPLCYGVRRRRVVSDETNRTNFIRRKNNDAVRNGHVSDGLSGKIRGQLDNNSGRDLRRKSGAELSADQGKPRDHERGVSDSNADRGGRIKQSRKATGEAATLTEDQYADFGWVRENDVLTNGEWEDFTSKFAGVLSGSIYAPQTKSGEYMVAVSDIDDKVNYGINNIIVYAKGSIESPQVTRVLEIDLDNETDLDRKRREIYALERRGIQQKAGGIRRLHIASDYGTRYDGQGTGRPSIENSSQLGTNRGAGSGGAAETAGRNVTLRRSGEKATLTLHGETLNSIGRPTYFEDVTGNRRTVWCFGPSRYCVENARGDTEAYYATAEAAIEAENESLIRGYAKVTGQGVGTVKHLLEEDSELLYRAAENDVRFSRKATGEVVTLSKGQYATLRADYAENADRRNTVYYDELYTDTDEFISEVTAADRHAFARSLANKTSGLAYGEKKTVEIYCGENIYWFKADGYMHGKMLRSVDSDDVDGRERARKDFENGVNADREITDLWTDLVSVGRDGTQGDISYSENRRRDGRADPVFEAERKSNGARDQGRSDANHRIDWEESDRLINKLREKIAELDAEEKERVKMSRKATGAVVTLSKAQTSAVRHNKKDDYVIFRGWAEGILSMEDRQLLRE
ncbi:MAG: hypothetical protein IJA78_00290 [Clostridia bacterium]|nr:hypothetical protein [Clostridia bacterium]